jgi:hypothetical protein
MNGVLQANGGFKIVKDITRISNARGVSTDIGANEFFAVRVLPCEPLLSIQRHSALRLVLAGTNWRSVAAEPSTHQHDDQECMFSLWSHTSLDTGELTLKPKLPLNRISASSREYRVQYGNTNPEATVNRRATAGPSTSVGMTQLLFFLLWALRVAAEFA